MKSIGAVFLRLDAIPGVNHMRGMHYQIVRKILNFFRNSTKTVVQICVHNSYTKHTTPCQPEKQEQGLRIRSLMGLMQCGLAGLAK